ncbi:MAG: carbohydrate kinase family protein [Actinomycetota bacterium]
MSKVLAVGVATLDTIVLVEKYPNADERVIAKETIQGFGGPAATAAVTMARLGIDVSLACVIGDDEAGRKIFDNLKREGVDTSNVVIDPKISTAIGTIVVSESTQSRAIMAQPHSEIPRKPSSIEGYSWIHVDHLGMSALKAWGVSRGGSAKLSIDIGYMYPGLKSSDYDLYAPSENIAIDVSSAKSDKNLVVISKGGAGSVYGDGVESGEVPALKGEILSTLGAGDVFHGALVAAQVWGKSARESVEIANVVAGLSCRALDGQSGIPSKAELDAYLAGVRS